MQNHVIVYQVKHNDGRVTLYVAPSCPSNDTEQVMARVHACMDAYENDGPGHPEDVLSFVRFVDDGERDTVGEMLDTLKPTRIKVLSDDLGSYQELRKPH